MNTVAKYVKKAVDKEKKQKRLLNGEKQRAYDRKRYHEKLKNDPKYKKRAAMRSKKVMRVSFNKLCEECQVNHLVDLAIKKLDNE